MDRTLRTLVVPAFVVALAWCVLPATPARAESCSATGSFLFTSGAGMGSLVLAPDGGATMSVTSGFICPTCLFPVRSLSGTYRTGTFGEDVCTFTLELSEPGRQPVTVAGVIAFQGLALLFQGSTDAGLAVGLALRNDALRGQ